MRRALRPSLLAGLLLAGVALLAVLVIGGSPPRAGAQSEGALQDRVERSKDRERALGSAAAHLARLEQAAARDVSVIQGRQAEVQADLNAAQGLLVRTEERLRAARRHLDSLQRRLATDRASLASQLRAGYMAQRPDLAAVVLDAEGFADLLERVEFVRRVEQRNTSVVTAVRAARTETARERRALAVLVPRRRDTALAVERRRDALAGMAATLQQRRQALTEARAARLAALSSTRARRRSAEKAIVRLEAERARAARVTSGPGGPWAIPTAIVQCESGGQNLPPNYASASGYYQFLDSTWKGLGGSTPHAYQASKAEQDRLAARLWNGGAGASNWVCASLVGVI